MRGKWSGLVLLLVVPWLTSCVTRPQIRLDTGQVHPSSIRLRPPSPRRWKSARRSSSKP